MGGVSELMVRIDQARRNHQVAGEQMSVAKGICQPSNPGCAIAYSVEALKDRINDGIDNRRTDVSTRENERRDSGSQGTGDGGGTDWAGYEILKNYMAGGEDWDIKNDPRWTEYMKNMPEGVDVDANGNTIITPPLEEQVKGEMLGIIPGLNVANVPEGQSVTVPIDHRFHAVGPNGESVNGYEFMHGTNADSGDFQIQGNATITNTGNGYTVKFNASHSWNDVMDPNGQYATDTAKSRASEILTLGRADEFSYRISWDEESTVHLDPNGNPVRVEGWPSD